MIESEICYELRFYSQEINSEKQIYLSGQCVKQHQLEIGLLDKLAELYANLPFNKGKFINIRYKKIEKEVK